MANDTKNETATRVSAKQKRELGIKELKAISVDNVLSDIELNAFYDMLDKSKVNAKDVLHNLIELYTSGEVKFKKKQIKQEILVYVKDGEK